MFVLILDVSNAKLFLLCYTPRWFLDKLFNLLHFHLAAENVQGFFHNIHCLLEFRIQIIDPKGLHYITNQRVYGFILFFNVTILDNSY